MHTRRLLFKHYGQSGIGTDMMWYYVSNIQCSRTLTVKRHCMGDHRKLISMMISIATSWSLLGCHGVLFLQKYSKFLWCFGQFNFGQIL